MYYTDILIRKFEDWVLYYFIHFTYHIYLFLSNFQLSIFIKVKFAQYVYVLIFMLHKLTHCWYHCIFCQFWKSLVWKKIGLPSFFRKSFLKSNLILLLSNLINHMRYWFLCTFYIITLCTYFYLEYWNFFYEQIFGLQNN